MAKEEEKKELELFRYGIISPLVYGDEKNVRGYCKRASGRKYYYKGKERQYSEETIRKWYYKYSNEGFDKMGKMVRKDKNKSRKLSEEAINYINELRSKYPKMTTKNIYNRLKEERYIDEKVDVQSFYRYVRSNRIGSRIITKQERRRYEQERPNDCWQADTTYGPYIVEKGKKYRTYLYR